MELALRRAGGLGRVGRGGRGHGGDRDRRRRLRPEQGRSRGLAVPLLLVGLRLVRGDRQPRLRLGRQPAVRVLPALALADPGLGLDPGLAVGRRHRPARERARVPRRRRGKPGEAAAPGGGRARLLAGLVRAAARLPRRARPRLCGLGGRARPAPPAARGGPARSGGGDAPPDRPRDRAPARASGPRAWSVLLARRRGAGRRRGGRGGRLLDAERRRGRRSSTPRSSGAARARRGSARGRSTSGRGPGRTPRS